MNKYICWIDGALKGNRLEGLTNPDILHGGWSCIICDDKNNIIDIIYSGKIGTTSNRMELTALLGGLMYFREPSQIMFYSDSEYVVTGVRKHIKEGFVATETMANYDLWKEIFNLCDKHSIDIIWVKGHNNTELNELADFWAQFAARCLNLQKDEYINNSKESGKPLVSESTTQWSDGINFGQENGKITYSLG